jgi:hypothetical protein
MINVLRGTVVLSLLLSVAACRGNDGEGGGSIPGDPNRQASEVTEAEWAEAGAAYEEQFEAFFTQETLCLVAGVMASSEAGIVGGAAMCNMIYDACMDPQSAMAEEIRGEADDMVPDMSENNMANCTATVAEVEACIDAIVALLEDLASGFNCENPELPDFDAMPEPAACAAIEETCPMMGDGEDMSTPPYVGSGQQQ